MRGPEKSIVWLVLGASLSAHKITHNVTTDKGPGQGTTSILTIIFTLMITT
jgi:hypothetical protein